MLTYTMNLGTTCLTRLPTRLFINIDVSVYTKFCLYITGLYCSSMKFLDMIPLLLMIVYAGSITGILVVVIVIDD